MVVTISALLSPDLSELQHEAHWFFYDDWNNRKVDYEENFKQELQDMYVIRNKSSLMNNPINKW